MAASIKLLLAIGTVVLLATGYVLYAFEDPAKMVEIRTGAIGDFVIGESKNEVLARALAHSFSPSPKPPECPANWIVVREMTQVQRTCLLHTDIWEADSVGTTTQCPKHTDEHTSLQFGGGRLAMVRVRCSRSS